MSRTTVEHTCQVCGDLFFITPTDMRRGRGKTCSVKCAAKITPQRQQGNRTIVHCRVCGKEISLMPCQVKRGQGKYCSRKCQGKMREASEEKQKYTYVDVDGKTCVSHRIIAAEFIGRHLLAEETIHHINGIRNDNRLENLMLFPSRGAHTKHHAGNGDPGVALLEIVEGGQG